MKKLKTTVRKSEELQGPTKTKKITVTDFKKETNKKPEVLNNNKEVLNNNNLVPYKGFVTGDNIYFHFYNHIKDEYLTETSEQYLKIKNYKKEQIRITYQLKKQNTQERKRLFIISMAM